MDTSALDQAYVALLKERDGLASHVAELEGELAADKERLRNVNVVIEGLQRLTESPNTPLGSSQAFAPLPVEQSAAEFGLVADAEGVERTDRKGGRINTAEPRQRIRSTEMVAELITGVGGPVSRDDVFELFRSRHGFPDSWSNPRNALGNALSRAVSRGLVDSMGSNHYAPHGFTDHVPPLRDSGGAEPLDSAEERA